MNEWNAETLKIRKSGNLLLLGIRNFLLKCESFPNKQTTQSLRFNMVENGYHHYNTQLQDKKSKGENEICIYSVCLEKHAQ